MIDMPWRVAKLGYIFSPGDIQDPPDRLSRHADKEIRLAKRFQDRERLLRIWNMLENLTAYYQFSGVRLRRQFEKRPGAVMIGRGRDSPLPCG